MTLFVGIAMLSIGNDTEDDSGGQTKGIICTVFGGAMLTGGFLQQHIVHRRRKREPPTPRRRNGPDRVEGRATNYVSSTPEKDIVICELSDGDEDATTTTNARDVPIWFTQDCDGVDVKL